MKLKVIVAGILSVCALSVHAEVKIGVTASMSGPASALGVPVANGIKIWPETIGGEKVKIVYLDDATDPAIGVKNTQRLVTDEKVDVIVGSSTTSISSAMADVAFESKTPHIAVSPSPVPAGKDFWTFRLAHSSGVMAAAVVKHMQSKNIKTVGFLGYSDAYGEPWLQDFKKYAEKAGIKIVATERFQRTDSSVTGQALKIVAAKPDAVLVVASGAGAVMPHKALKERGYQGIIYQTHAAASRDLMRVGGKDVEGAYVVSGPAVVAEQLPDSNPSKALAMDFVSKYEKVYGPTTRNQFAAHSYDVQMLLEKIIPIAAKQAKPGTPEFRAALRDALESLGSMPVSQGTVHYTKDDHWGFTDNSAVILKVVNGEWAVEP